MSEWQPMKTAPFDQEVELLVKGKPLRCIFTSGFASTIGEDCCCWQTEDEFDEGTPECWTDGVCWEVNADLQRSAQPTGWRPI